MKHRLLLTAFALMTTYAHAKAPFDVCSESNFDKAVETRTALYANDGNTSQISDTLKRKTLAKSLGYEVLDAHCTQNQTSQEGLYTALESHIAEYASRAIGIKSIRESLPRSHRKVFDQTNLVQRLQQRSVAYARK